MFLGIRIKFLLLLFLLIVNINASEIYINAKVIYNNELNSSRDFIDINAEIKNLSTKEVYINLPSFLIEKYYIHYSGDIAEVNDNIYQPDGTGYIRYIRKSDYFISPKQKVESQKGIFNNEILFNPNSFYKCLDNECYEKEYSGTLIYKQQRQDQNNTVITLKTEEYTYQGTLRENNQTITIDGIGTLDTRSSTYTGEFKDFNITGYGTFKTKLNNSLNLEVEQIGSWENGHFKEGYLSTVYQDGGIYKGESLNGFPHGKGTFVWSDKSSYTGSFKQGKKDGFGTYTFKDGSIYAGNYKNDKKYGYGELYIKSKDIYYKGEFKNGKFEGEGELYIQGETTYIGEFKDNVPIGKGELIDENDNVTEVITINGNMSQLNLPYSFLDNFPFQSANAGWLSDKFNSIVNSVTTAVKDASEWVVDNKEHLVNAVKGCIAGGVGGVATGAVAGAGVGAGVGALAGGVGAAPGAIVGAAGGALAGGLNGCINQAQKAFEISEANNGNYTWEDAKQAVVDEISIENSLVGALGGLSMAFVAISSRILVKTPALQNSIKFLSSKGNKVKEKICKINYMKDSSFCKVSKQDNNKDQNQKHIKELKIVSWNLLNLSPRVIQNNSKKRSEIKKFINNQFMFGVDIVFLQEILDNKKEKIEHSFFQKKDIKSPYMVYISDYMGIGNKERSAILVHPKVLNKLKITPSQIKEVQLKSYKKYERPPYGLRLGKKLIVMNTHIIEGSSKYDRLKKNGQSFLESGKVVSKKWRLDEVKLLRKDIYQLLRYYNIHSNNYIIAGDWNLDKLTLQNIFKKGNVTTDGLTTNANNYDHIITNLKVKKDIVSTINRVNVSDHSPIRVTLNINTKSTKAKIRH